jgi:hypothetical protein
MTDDSTTKPNAFTSTQSLMSKYQLQDAGGYITREFQDFGYRLAMELNDPSHKSLYIKMAKTTDRSILERALSFVSDSQANSKARLFMWKVKMLKTEAKDKVKKSDQKS